MQFWVTDGKDITRKEAETLVSPWDVCLEEWSWCHRYPCMFSEEEGSVDLEGRCERSRGGMRQRGYQFVEGSLCPISSVRGHVPRVLTLVTSLASSLPGDPGPGVFITYLHPYPHPTNTLMHNPPNTILLMEVNKSPSVTPQPGYVNSHPYRYIWWYMYLFAFTLTKQAAFTHCRHILLKLAYTCSI